MLPVRVGLKSFIVGSGRNGTGKLHCQSPHGHIAQWIEHFPPKETVVRFDSYCVHYNVFFSVFGAKLKSFELIK